MTDPPSPARGQGLLRRRVRLRRRGRCSSATPTTPVASGSPAGSPTGSTCAPASGCSTSPAAAAPPHCCSPREYGAPVDGVDLRPPTSPAAGTAAGRRPRRAGRLHGPATPSTFPSPDEAFDAVVCECAFCTFPDKPTAAAEFARVLQPGGRLGITDVTVDPDRPARRADQARPPGSPASPTPARSTSTPQLLTAAGLRVTHTERHDDGDRSR